MPPIPTSPQPARQPPLAVEGRAQGLENAAGLNNFKQLIQLRWIAVVGQIVTIGVASLGLGIALPVWQLVAVVMAQILFNFASLAHWHITREITQAELFCALLVDVGALTLLLYFTGGAANPFVFLYLLQVALGAVLLKPRYTWAMVVITALCFVGLAWLCHPLSLPLDHDKGLFSHYTQGMLICFVLIAVLLVVFITRIGRNLRRRDARLAHLRQRAAEEEHIVRMGLLASGAAHELGTPLSTMAVILGDWARLPTFTSEPELLAEVNEMEAQVLRCKAIVSGILMSAGEARGESSLQTTIGAFMDGLVEEWRASRPTSSFVYNNRLVQDLPMVSDSTLKQMLTNLLDNAQEASPSHVSLEVDQDMAAETLIFTVKDNGPGFAPRILAQLGKPYQSTKNRPGRGLGLFLVFNVARTLGGSVTARNRLGGGAVVTITLPLSAIAIAEDFGRDAP